MDNERFIKESERLVDPITVGFAHAAQRFFATLPVSLQRKILKRSTSANPYMGFVVEPYATFLLYEVIDERCAQALLPEGFTLAKAQAFEGDRPAHYAILSFFRAHTSAFWGARAEFYLIAKDERTGLVSWVIVDYLSDTISYDNAHGLRGPSAPHAVVTTTADGRVLADLRDAAGGRAVAFDVTLANAVTRRLDQRLWVEGNLSVAYGPRLSPHDAGVFSLTFPTEEMASAWELPLEDLRMRHMTWHDELLAPMPSTVACFPYAQHLLSDSPGEASSYKSVDDLERAVREMDPSTLTTFSPMPSGRKKLAMAALSLGALAVVAVALMVP